MHTTYGADEDVNFAVEADFMGHGAWWRCENLHVPAHGYAYHVFPTGFSAHWVRVTADATCVASAQFVYRLGSARTNAFRC